MTDSLAPRSLFSGTRRVAYLNTAAEGLAPAAFAEALAAYARDKTRGSDGRTGMYAVEQRCRERAAALLGADPAEVAFVTSCARGINAALSAVRLVRGDVLVTTDLEFPTTDLTAVRLRDSGVEVRIARSAAGLEFLVQYDAGAVAAHVRALGGRLRDELAARGLAPLGPGAAGERAGIVAIADGRAEEHTAALRERGVLVWGRAGRLRASVHLYNDSSDIERLLEALPPTLLPRRSA